MKTKKRVTLLLVSVIIAVLILVVIVQAAEVDIDTFDDVQGSQFDQDDEVSMRDPGFFVFGQWAMTNTEVVTGTGVLGVERDLAITRTSGSGSYVNLYLDVENSDELKFNTGDGIRGVATIQWDGEDGDPHSLDADGLGGEDLSDGGSNEGFLFVVSSSERLSEVTIEVYSNTAVATRTVGLPDDLADDPSRMDVFVPFTDFSGDAAVFTSAGAIVFFIDARLESNLDLAIDLFSATTVREYGDLPTATYEARTLDAYHIPGTLRLGNNVDAEGAPNESSDAAGDDEYDFDDEAGVGRTDSDTWSATNGATVTVKYEGCTELGGCAIHGWIDWDRDGYFTGTLEHVVSANETSDSATGKNYTFSVPSGTSFESDSYYARFRICENSADCDDPGVTDTGVSNGEIEDYMWSWQPTAITLTDITARSNSLYVALGAVAVAALGLMGTVVLLRRRRA